MSRISRLRAICFTVTVIGTITLILLGRPSSFITPKVTAQSQTQLVPLVTDQTPLALSNRVGMGGGGVVNQAGDFAFFGGGGSAVFYRRAGAGSLVRVMQMGDEVPGFPGSRADIIQVIKLNNSGVLAFRPDIFLTNGDIQGAIFTFDGTSLHQVVSGIDQAPGGGGQPFGRTLNVAGLNDSGDVAFTAPLVAPNSVLPAQTTLYIAPGGGAPVRIAGVGDAAPGIAGGTLTTLTAIGFNNIGQAGFSNSGEELFSATVAVGASTIQALFVGSLAGGVRKVVATGDVRPEGGVFPAPTLGLMNNAGQVAFQAGSIYVNTPGSGTLQTVAAGDAVPAPVGGNLADAGSLLTFDDAGDIVFNAGITNVPASNNFGLFRFRPASPPSARLEVVAYRGQAAAGTAGESFSNSFTVSINNTGVVSFRATLTGGSILNGIFQQTGTSAPVNIALDSQATTLAGGGSYSLSFVSNQTLNDGSVYFRSDVAGGTADYAEVLVSGAATTVLMSTADTLPPGGRVSLRSFRVGAAGGFVGFLAQRAGGPFSLVAHNIATQATSVLVSDRDMAPGTGGGLLRIATRNTVFLNANGSTVFAAQLIGGSVPGSTGIFLAAPGGGLTKIAVNGDVVSGTGGKIVSGITFTAVTPSPINDSGQVVFVASLVTPITLAITRTVCVWSPGTGLAKVAAVGEIPSTGGAAITSFPVSIGLSINSAGQVAFGATTAGGPTGIIGIFIGAPGGSFAKVVGAGDSGPSGSTFASFVTPAFNDSGEVAFMATLTGGPGGGGVFVGSTSVAPVAIALNGAAAPAGGNFSITAARPDVAINNQHDVAFRGDLTGGAADSGFFIRRGPSGTLQAPLLQGQPAPGTSGVFDTALTSINNLLNENLQLGPDGDLAIQSLFLAGGKRSLGLWHLKTDNTIEEIVVRGTVATEFGGGTAVSSPSTAWNSGGRYPVWAGVSGGTFTDAIFLFVPTVNTNTPGGTNVPVTVTDATTGTTPVTMNFDSISTPGVTSLTTSSGGPAISAAFALGNPPVFYNLETTATFSGSVGVCIDFANVSFPAGSTLRMLHFQGGAWVDVTTSGPTGTVICGSVTSLSPFTVARVSPTASGSEIAGTITTADGTPLGGVVLQLAGTTATFTTTDSAGHYRFANLDTGSFYTITPQLVNYGFSPGARSFSLVGNRTEAAFTGIPDAVARANPLDTSEYFVRQQYVDFLGREPDQAGLAYWVGQINSCNGDAGCIRARRIAVSNAFFHEQEYQRTGSYVFRLYRAAFGNSQPQPNPDSAKPTEAQKLPSYAAFAADRGRVLGGATLAQSQLDMAKAFVQRTEFAARYPASLDGPGFVESLLTTIRNDSGADLSLQRQALLDLYDAGGRGNVLYRLADDNPDTNPVDNRSFIDLEYNRAFVFTQYAGYLRRDADINGFLFWLGQVDSAPLRDTAKQQAMVCSFITADEYQFRFSQVRTQSNADCH